LNKSSHFLFLFETGALSSYIWHRSVYDWMAGKESPPFLFILTFLATSVVIGSVLYSGLSLFTRFLASSNLKDRSALKHSIVRGFFPLLFLYLTFLEYVIYLRDIQNILLLTTILAIAYMQYSLWEKLHKGSSQDSLPTDRGKGLLQKIRQPKEMSLCVLIISVGIFIFYSLGLIFPVHPITGDEPHYLLITDSLLSDGDINLFNNYRDKDYLQFYPGELESHSQSGKKGLEYQYSKHTPGLSVLLAPPYFIGKKLGGIVAHRTHDPTRQQHILTSTIRMFMALLTALLCWLSFLFARDLTKNQNAALLAWFIFVMTSPLLFYSQLVYPEVPAALILIMVLQRATADKHISPSSLLWISLGIAFLPWLGVKYIVLSAGLFGIVLYAFWKSARKGGMNILLFFAPLLISAGLFLYYLWSLYGNLWPSSPYRGSLHSEFATLLSIFHFKISEFFRCGLSYLFDQRIGIFPYSPIYMICVPGVFLLIANQKRKFWPPLGIFLLYWGFCSMTYYWGGFCPPGRPLLPVLWILALSAAGALAWGKNRLSVSVQRFLIFASLGIAFLCAKEPRLLYDESLSGIGNPSGNYSHLLTSLSNSFVNLRTAAPSLINKDNIIWTPLIFWLFALAVVCFAFLKKDKKLVPAFRSFGTPALAVLFLSTLIIVYTFFDCNLDKAYVFENKAYQLYFQDSNNFGQELKGFWTRGRSASEVLMRTETRVSEIRVKLSSPVPGKATVHVGKEKRIVPRSRQGGQTKTLIFSSPVEFPWKKGCLYSIRIREDTGFRPYRLDPEVQDNRFLGVFVEIDVTMGTK